MVQYLLKYFYTRMLIFDYQINFVNSQNNPTNSKGYFRKKSLKFSFKDVQNTTISDLDIV